MKRHDPVFAKGAVVLLDTFKKFEPIFLKDVLLVDDERNILYMLARALRCRGWNVFLAAGFDEALRAFDAHQPPVVIVDVRLADTPSMSGLDLLEEMKRREPKTRVVVITAYGSPEILREAREKGADYYFEKPVDVFHFLNQVEELCGL